jgi:Uma2 family endonuclease
VFPAPTDVYFSDDNVPEPDALYVGPEHAERVEERFVRSAPDLVVEVSSPSTRHLQLVRKRDLYERYGVPEYWYVDLDADRVEVYRLQGDRYGRPSLVVVRGEVIESSAAPGSSIAVGDLLGPPKG